MDIFEIYYSYLRGCAEVNDPDGEKGVWEWHHILPQCLFGDTPVGQWLTKEQHARASVIQTLAFDHCCVTRFHKKYLSAELWKITKEHRDRLNLGKPELMLQALRESGRLENPTEAQLVARRETARRNRETLDWSKVSKSGAQATNQQRWECQVTGKVMPPGPLTIWQRRHNVDPSMRVRIK